MPKYPTAIRLLSSSSAKINIPNELQPQGPHLRRTSAFAPRVHGPNLRPCPPESWARRRPRPRAPAQLPTARQPAESRSREASASDISLPASPNSSSRCPRRPARVSPEDPPPLSTSANRRPVCSISSPPNKTESTPEAWPSPIPTAPSETDTCLRQFWRTLARCLGPGSKGCGWTARAPTGCTYIGTATGTQDLGSQGRSLWQEQGENTKPCA